MFAKYVIPALCASVSLQGVAAAGHHHHRHAHPQLEKKEIVYAETDVVVVTEYVTATVYGDDEPATTTTTARPSGSFHRGKRPHKRPSSSVTTTTEAPAATTPEVEVAEVATTTTPVYVPTTSAEVAAAAAPTTMVTSVAAPAPTTTTAANIVAQAVSVVSSAVAQVSSAVTSSSSSSSSGRRGIAFNDVALANSVIAASGGKFTWAYNWGATSGGLTGVPFYPTCWSPGKSSGWSTNAAKAIANGADALFSFNECDIATQCALDPPSAAAAHIQLMVPFAGQARIGAPAISSSQNANQGVDWLKQFFTACNGQCEISFCNAHWYGPGGEAGAKQFLSHLVDVHNACGGLPVFVTEFKAEDSAENELAFMKYAINQLDTNSDYSFVEKYSYFFLADGFLTTSSALNQFGSLYESL